MVQEEQITASYHGERCRHNGENPNYELACDECPDYMICFPDWQYLAEKYDCSNEKTSIPSKCHLTRICRPTCRPMQQRMILQR